MTKGKTDADGTRRQMTEEYLPYRVSTYEALERPTAGERAKDISEAVHKRQTGS